MNKTAVKNLAQELVEANPDSLNDPDSYLLHVEQVYSLAEKIVANILKRYPKIPLIKEEISLASGLHDIGRPMQKDQTFHELRGARYIEQKGLEKGVAHSLKEAYRIAQMFRSHGFVYEFWQDSSFSESRKEFEPLEACLLVPRTWQEAIVTYSDLASQKGQRIKVQDRMAELFDRYEHDSKYKNAGVVRVAKTAFPRILELAERIEALEQGKLTEHDIARFGFL